MKKFEIYVKYVEGTPKKREYHKTNWGSDTLEKAKENAASIMLVQDDGMYRYGGVRIINEQGEVVHCEEQKTCGRCGVVIPAERLAILPETKICVKCSEAVGSDIETIIIEENLGGSIVSKPMIHKRIRDLDSLEE